MYLSVPGCSRIKMLVPAPPRPPIAGPEMDPSARQAARSRVLVALEVGYGLRSPRQLRVHLFSPACRGAVLRMRRRHPAAGAVRLVSFHLRERGECFGTVLVDGVPRGFIAGMEADTLARIKVY